MSDHQINWGWRVALGVLIVVVWQWGYAFRAQVPWLTPEILNPYFVSKPSAIFHQFLQQGCLVSYKGTWNGWSAGRFGRCLRQNDNNLWVATLSTMRNTLLGFAGGVGSGFVLGLLIGRSDRLTGIFQPFIIAANSVPRIALAPLIILTFGIGNLSKIVTAWLVVIFLVFFNTFEGARAVDRNHINAARLLGATEWKVTSSVIVPSTMAWLFASLTPAISLALIGEIVGEFMGSERGLGRVIIVAQAQGDAAGMMVAVIVLMIVGVVLSAVVHRVQTRLLRWQAA